MVQNFSPDLKCQECIGNHYQTLSGNRKCARLTYQTDTCGKEGCKANVVLLPWAPTFWVYGRTVIHGRKYCVEICRLWVVEKAASHRSEGNQTGHNGNTSAHFHKNPEAKLVAHAADVTNRGKTGCSNLGAACYTNAEVVAHFVILQAGIQRNQICLQRHVDIVHIQIHTAILPLVVKNFIKPTTKSEHGNIGGAKSDEFINCQRNHF